MSWIHIDDIAGLFQLAVENAAAIGPINGTAPHPVRNAEFSKTLSSVLWKPYAPWRLFIPLGPPDAVLKLMLGEVAGVITAGQKVLPRRAKSSAIASSSPTWRTPSATSSPTSRPPRSPGKSTSRPAPAPITDAASGPVAGHVT